MKRVICLFALSALMLSGLSDADARSYRKYRKHRGFKSKKKSRRIQRINKPTQKKIVIKKRGPMKLQAFERFAQERLQQKTEAQIATLTQIISSTPQQSRADLYFRLAEHYWENSKYYNFIANRYDDYRGRPEWPEKSRLQQQAFATSKGYKKKAASVYYKIIKGYPNYSRLCEAYYFLGKNLFEMGKQKAALNVFRPMISKFRFPACPFVPNAYLSFGEYYFNNGQVQHAMKSYQQVLTFRNASIYGFALYKIAWCYYNLVKYRTSLKHFIAVVNYAKRASAVGGNQRRRLALLKEALRDLVMAYSQIGSEQEARDAKNRFLNLGGQGRYVKMLRSLGRLYRGQGKLQHAIIVYRDLININPESPRVLFYQLYITQAINRSKDKEATVRAVAQLVRKVNYFKKRGGGGKIYKRAVKEILFQINQYARYRLYEAQKTRTMSFYIQAGNFFGSYLSVDSKSKNAYEMMFWRAEIFYRQRRFAKAATIYKQALLLNPKGKYSADCAYNRILAYNFLLKRARFNLDDMTKKRTTQKKALPKLAKKFLGACEDYLKYFPKKPQAIDVSYKAALLYYYFNHFDKALPSFYFLVKRYPTHEYAIYSAHFILDTYNLQKRWVKLNKTAWDFYRRPGLGNAKFKKEVRDIIVGSGIKTCEAIERKKKYGECAKCFSKMAREFPDRKRLASHALYNASLCYYKNKQPEQALSSRRILIDKYPRSQHVKKSILDLADIYATRADFSKAAKYYEKYYNKYKNKRTPHWDILIQAALFREAMGDTTTAMKYYRKMINDKKFRFKNKKRFVALYFRVAKNYKKSGSTSIYRRMMKNFDKKRLGPYPMRLYARMELAKTRPRSPDSKRAFRSIPRAYDSLPAEGKKVDEARKSAAHVRFMQAEEKFKDYTKVQLRPGLSQAQIKRIMDKKTKLFKKAFKAYETVVKYKDGDWGVAAYYRAGDLFMNFSKFFYGAPPPSAKKVRTLAKKEIKKLIYKQVMGVLKTKKGIPWRVKRAIARKQAAKFIRSQRGRMLIQQQVQKFQDNNKMLVQSQAQPFEERAIKLYKKCLKLAHRLLAYNPWTQKALAHLQKLQPQKSPKQVELAPKVGYAASDFSFQKGLMTNMKRASAPMSKFKRKMSMARQPRQ